MLGCLKDRTAELMNLQFFHFSGIFYVGAVKYIFHRTIRYLNEV